MNLDQLNKWLTLAANFGVLAGIIFLGLEIRQSNRIAIATTEASVRAIYAEFNQSIYSNPQIAELLRRDAESKSDFSPAEMEMLYSYAMTLWNIWAAVETGHANGMLPQATLDDAIDDVVVMVKYYKPLRQIWRDILIDYPSYERTEIYKVLDQSLREFDE